MVETTEELAPPEVSKRPLREMIFLAEQAAEEGIKVVPGKKWALHYPQGGGPRMELLEALKEGKREPEEVADQLRPTGIVYNLDDLEDENGLEQVVRHIRDLSLRVHHYDYPRFATFAKGMKGVDIPIQDLQRIYSGIQSARIRRQILDAAMDEGKKAAEAVLREQARRSVRRIEVLEEGPERIMEMMKVEWMTEDLKLIGKGKRDELKKKLTPSELRIVSQNTQSYREYVESGREEAYDRVTGGIKRFFQQKKDPPAPSPQSSEEKMSDSMEELKKKLEPFMDQVGPPGSPDDPAIPPDDSDEYITPPPLPPGQTGPTSPEQQQQQPLFIIEPAGTSTKAMVGSFATGRKSYYDVATKTWSKKKQLTPFTDWNAGTERQKISGIIDGPLKALPLPVGYAPDVSSLVIKGGETPRFHRDQKGCFYVEADGVSSFSIEFLKENPPFLSSPISEDTVPLSGTPLSPATEAMITGLAGKPALLQAQEAHTYLLKNHHYPGGGDLDAAQALQHKLRTESTPDNYLPNLDASEYLECYFANTLFVHMMRRAGVPARLVIGHMLDASNAKDGKTFIGMNTGHAWSEIWNGTEWIRVDATPGPKAADKKKEPPKPKSDDGKTEGEEEKPTPIQEADDGGIDFPKPPEELDEREEAEEGGEKTPADQVRDGMTKTMDGLEEESPVPPSMLDDLDQVDEDTFKNAESELEQAREQLDKMEQRKNELDQKIQEAETFQKLQEILDEIEEEDLFDEMKEDLEKRVDAKKDEMKDEMRDNLDHMVEEGFVDEDRRKEFEKAIEKADLDELDRLKEEIDMESRLYDEYQAIKEDVMPLVEQWWRYFTENLPVENDMEVDEDAHHRAGIFDRRSVFKPRNLIMGTVRNPRIFKPGVKPKFIASILVDVSGSMGGEKLRMARKMLVFYSELFSRIGSTFGYIRFSIHIFSDFLQLIKDFGQEYDSSQRYDFATGQLQTIKVRLMKSVAVSGGTNMLPAIQAMGDALNAEQQDFPEHLTALYFMGDGDDTCGNSTMIKDFLTQRDTNGFGDHIRSATLLGNEANRKLLAKIFGDENTHVANDFETLVEESMNQLATDIQEYIGPIARKGGW